MTAQICKLKQEDKAGTTAISASSKIERRTVNKIPTQDGGKGMGRPTAQKIWSRNLQKQVFGIIRPLRYGPLSLCGLVRNTVKAFRLCGDELKGVEQPQCREAFS